MPTFTPDRAAPRSDDEALTAQQMQQAEELLFSEPPREGFAKALFRGEFRGDIVFPYPQLPASQRETVENAVAAVRVFTHSHIDPAAIDRDADSPRSVIEGLGELGVLGMTAP
ncbi:MAG: acyl-CoA dehydrogenase family protein, partial [Isosphaeraceae bacterium]